MIGPEPKPDYLCHAIVMTLQDSFGADAIYRPNLHAIDKTEKARITIVFMEAGETG